jgi:hypothetical protein
MVTTTNNAIPDAAVTMLKRFGYSNPNRTESRSNPTIVKKQNIQKLMLTIL